MTMKRIKVDALVPGDIVLTASKSAAGKGIRVATGATVSHAMICVQNGSVIDSTGAGVQARNVQRELFKPAEKVFAFRMRVPLQAVQLARVISFARSEIGTRYSAREAVLSVAPGRRRRDRRQFCSRLVARAYAYAGVQLVADQDYCTPDELRLSPFLYELDDLTEQISAAELAAWRARPDPIAMTHTAQNAILDGVRRLDPSVEHFGDVDRIVREHPEWDGRIAELYRSSGYLDLWKTDFVVNPWHYDLTAMDAFVDDANHEQVRAYCRSMIAEIISGGSRYALMLDHFRQSNRLAPRQTTLLLVALYEQLTRNDHLLRATALAWLQRHHPDDVAAYLGRAPALAWR